MAKICSRGMNRFQVYSVNGDVRLCSWMRDMHLGNLIDNTVEELYNNEAAKRIKNRLLAQDYSMCIVDSCPYLANNSLAEELIDYDPEQRFPKRLALAFETTCNYACTGCTYHSKLHGKDMEQIERNYEIIEERLREVLPHVTYISANGCGELFASKHILKLLSEWNPDVGIENTEVSLESNGSMFDEKHWKQIENLGKANLSVSITVMSFDEDIYRYLSGTKLPISQIENNLRFIKGLREKNIINHLELCTVVQEQNFREMPRFARRCIEEFGADSVRLRPFVAWGAKEEDIEWFANVRNPRHPMYNDYKRVMSDPIFKHPAVDDWSGEMDSVDSTYSPLQMSKAENKMLSYFWKNSDNFLGKIRSMTPGENGKVAVYGVTDLAKSIVDKIDSTQGFQLEYMIDRDCKDWYYGEKRIWRHIHLKEQDKGLLVIVAQIKRKEQIVSFLKSEGYENVVTIDELVEDYELINELNEILG